MRGLILSGENSTRKKKKTGGGGVEVVQNSPLNAHAEVTIRERCLTLDLSHYLHICFVALSLRGVKALPSLCVCTGSPGPSLLAYAFSTIMSCAWPYMLNRPSAPLTPSPPKVKVLVP